MFKADWSRIHEETAFRASTIPLAAMSFLYGLGVKIDHSLKKRKAQKLPGFVLSVGNITAGGTGKTPAAIMLAEWAKSQGYNTAILSRGYGGSYKDKTAVVSDGNKILLSADICGDEPWLMASRLKNVPVIVSGSRYLAGLKAKEKFNSNFFILDDGFQHIRLKRDMDILLADAEKPFGNGHLLPWGPLREPRSGIKRADAVILTRAEENSAEYDNNVFYNKPLFKGGHRPDKIILSAAGKVLEPSYIDNKRVIAFSGIAKPDSFKNSLLKLGANIVCFRAFGDHYTFTRDDLLKISEEQKALDAELIITTEKDLSRLGDKACDIDKLSCLTIEFEIKGGKEKLFNMIKTKADAVLS